MPVTFKSSSIRENAEKFDGKNIHNIIEAFQSLDQYKKSAGGKILQCSKIVGENRFVTHRWDNGFISAIFEAYNKHHNLVLRPDDIWLSILVQFSLYVNDRAEELRKNFVTHDGQKELQVYQTATLLSADYSSMAQKMTEGIQKNLVEGEVREWILPNFTTTTANDTTVASVVMMSAMQNYFKYKLCLKCGIPNVTLLGDLSDWENIRKRLDKLPEYDLKDNLMSKWKNMLVPILDEFISAFKGEPNIDFWDKICHYTSGGSGPSYLSGWVTAFCVFNVKGKWQGTIKNVIWPVIDSVDIPPGVVSVPVLIDDNGIEHKSYMFAGHLAFQLKENNTTLQPSLDWAIALEK